MKRIKNWDILAFLVTYHILLLALLPWVVQHFSWVGVGFFIVTNLLGGLSITVGYHRLFSHKTYQAHPIFEAVVLCLATLAFQWSALGWSYDHRKHHTHVDTDEDPYSIKKGFWYAHFLWLLDYRQQIDESVVDDLVKNPRVMFQHRHFLLLTIVVNLAVLGLACLFMHPVTALYFSFVLRVFCIHHSTWFINSLAHTWGSRTYAKELSAVDNAVLALLTFGEGYHNYHHTFANDYRNGVKWWHFDPTKWIIWTAAKLGWVSNLRRVDNIRLQKIIVRKDLHLISDFFEHHLRHHTDPAAAAFHQKLSDLYETFNTQSSRLSRLVVEKRKAASAETRKLIQVEMRMIQRQLRSTWSAWVETTALIGRKYQLEHAH
ncbi:MAG: fatty acid desaturase [Puniceicoccaceae bacterium]